MTAVVLESKSKSDIYLLIELAKKIGINTHLLSAEEIENLSMANAIKEGETGEYIDTLKYISKLRK